MAQKTISKKGEVELSTGKKIIIKEMSIDDMDYCSDVAEILYDPQGEVKSVRNVSQSRTAWLRRGIKGGDFPDLTINTKGHIDDKSIRTLTEEERNELLPLIQEFQILGE